MSRATRPPKEDAPTGSVAGRLFGFSERSEEALLNAMRDLDEIGRNAARVYPGNTWSRSELLLVFFLDSMADSLGRIEDALVERGDL